MVTFVYFMPDDKKAGAAYVTNTGRLKKSMSMNECIILTDNTQIPMEHLFSMDCDLFGGQKK